MALGDVLLCALALASSGAALPTKNGPKAAAQLNRREEITAYDDSLAAPTTVAAEVAYLQGGAPVSTDTKTIVVLPTAPRSVSLPSDDADAKILEALGLPGSAAPSPTAPGKADKFGISYAPYRGDHGCKDARDVQNDFDQLKDYSVIRIYGTDCDQVSKTYKAAKNTKTKLMLGVWDINDVENEVSKIIAGVEGGWDKIQAVSVGNEVVNKGEANPRRSSVPLRRLAACFVEQASRALLSLSILSTPLRSTPSSVRLPTFALSMPMPSLTALLARPTPESGWMTPSSESSWPFPSRWTWWLPRPVGQWMALPMVWQFLVWRTRN
uniref:1,3-beta-glucanosyltransferase n=1 Tax=Bionectria ochroleuca TaxID=29856 RepID=A0A8H7K2A3_BIOOC